MSRLADADDFQGASERVVEWLDGGRYFDHGITDGHDAEGSIGVRENLALDDAICSRKW